MQPKSELSIIVKIVALGLKILYNDYGGSYSTKRKGFKMNLKIRLLALPIVLALAFLVDFICLITCEHECSLC